MQAENNLKTSVKQLRRTLQFPIPSLGIVAEIRRPRLAAWVTAGKIPDRLLAIIGAARVEDAHIEGQDFKALIELATELAKDSFIWPKVVDEPDENSDDEIAAGDISLNDLSEFAGWALRSCPGLAIPTTGGEVSADALSSFRQDPSVSGAGAGGGSLQTEPRATDGNS